MNDPITLGSWKSENGQDYGSVEREHGVVAIISQQRNTRYRFSFVDWCWIGDDGSVMWGILDCTSYPMIFKQRFPYGESGKSV